MISNKVRSKVDAGNWVNWKDESAGNGTWFSPSSTNSTFDLNVIPIDDHRALYIWNEYNGAIWTPRCRLLTRDGLTITEGSETILDAVASVGNISAARIGAGKVFIAYNDSSYSTAWSTKGIVVTVNDAGTITKGSVVLIHVADTTTNACVRLADDRVVVLVNDWTSADPKARVCTVSGTTITVGAAKILATTNVSTSKRDLIPTGTNQFTFYYRDFGSPNYLKGVPCTISGTTITTGTIVNIASIATGSLLYQNDAIGTHNNFGVVSYYTYLNAALPQLLTHKVALIEQSGTSLTLHSVDNTFYTVTADTGDTNSSGTDRISKNQVYCFNGNYDSSASTAFVKGVVITHDATTLTVGTAYTTDSTYWQNSSDDGPLMDHFPQNSDYFIEAKSQNNNIGNRIDQRVRIVWNKG